MMVETAIQLINESLIFRPSWKFSAMDNRKRFEDTVAIRIDYDAFETNRPEAMEGYKVANRPYATFTMIVRDLHDMVDLAYELLKVIECIDSHESRETLRFRPDAWSPFHPHRIEGMQRWSARKGTPMLLDLQFGLA